MVLTSSSKGKMDRYKSYLDELVTGLMTLQFEEKTFKAAKSDLFKRYRNSAIESSTDRVMELFNCAVCKEYAPKQTKKAMINKINFESFQKFAKSIYRQTYVEGMVTGNASPEEMKGFLSRVQKTLHSKPYAKEKQWVMVGADPAQIAGDYLQIEEQIL